MILCAGRLGVNIQPSFYVIILVNGLWNMLDPIMSLYNRKESV